MIGQGFGRSGGDAEAKRAARVAMLRDARSAGASASGVPPVADDAPKPRGEAVSPFADAARDPWAEPWDDEPRVPLRRRLAGGMLGIVNLLVLIVVIGGLGFAGGGFLHYFDEVESFAPPAISDMPRADGIVVLTGGARRLEAAGRLLEDGRADHLLVSGVNLRTTEPQIRRLLGVADNLFACCVELGFEARDTMGNARETAAWFERLTDEASGALGPSEEERLIVVTSNYHMRRALHELGRALPAVRLDAYPVRGLNLSDEGWWREPGNWRLLLAEYGKLVLARARDVPPLARVLDGIVTPPPAADR